MAVRFRARAEESRAVHVIRVPIVCEVSRTDAQVRAVRRQLRAAFLQQRCSGSVGLLNPLLVDAGRAVQIGASR